LFDNADEKTEIRFIDLFSGIGGFRLGLERAGGYRCVWSCDHNKYANQVYIHRFGEEGHYSGDVRGIDAKTIPDFDLLCAGFPCQSFSVAGHRKGFTDTRGTLFFEILRIAEAKKPVLLLLENVRGLLSNDKGATFQIILESLEDLGYFSEWQLLNSRYLGVPQNRERVFLVGHLGTRGGREIFPIGQTDELAKKEGNGRPQVQPETSSAIHSRYEAGWRAHAQEQLVIPVLTPERYEKKQHGRRFKDAGEPMYTLTGQDQHGVIIHNLYGGFKEGIRVFEDYSPTIRTAKGGGHIPSVAIVADRSRHLNKKGRNLESPKPFTNALSSVQKDNLLLQDLKIRKLTPLECERLQGFPDGWTDILSDTQRYKCIGNAVTVNVVQFLGYRLKQSLMGVYPQSQSIEYTPNGQSEPNGANPDAKATNGASPCPTDLSSYHAEAT